jgi:hypothetical protein
MIGFSGNRASARLRVGRLDSATPSPPGQLPPADVTNPNFLTFWAARNFSADEAVALLGSHALIDDQVRLTKSGLLISVRAS